jgi:RNA-directed DNA polymerase
LVTSGFAHNGGTIPTMPTSGLWHLSFYWQAERTRILKSLQRGDNSFAPLQVITKADGTIIDLWRSPNALVLKALTIAIAPSLPISRRCTHVTGNGGLKYSVRKVQHHLAANQFVMRTDVKVFYESIDHHLLLEKLALYLTDRFTFPTTPLRQFRYHRHR